MDLDSLRLRAVAIAELYDRHNVAAGRGAWSTGDLALGFVGDVGDLAKLVMAVDGRREITDARERLGTSWLTVSGRFWFLLTGMAST